MTHRARLVLAPVPRLDLSFDRYLHSAETRNNLGANPALGTLASPELGQAFQFTARWAIARKLFAPGTAGIALPGRAIRAPTISGPRRGRSSSGRSEPMPTQPRFPPEATLTDPGSPRETPR